ncbi:MAG: hypothetical protein JO020_16040 [Chloroflexi bacterium]|nr:hypothetical protein [Chloroflexota bacterium]
MPTPLRLTQSGACASCYVYGGTPHRSCCRPDVVRRIPMGKPDRDGCFMSALKDVASLDDEDQWRQLWYGPRLRRGMRA